EQDVRRPRHVQEHVRDRLPYPAVLEHELRVEPEPEADARENAGEKIGADVGVQQRLHSRGHRTGAERVGDLLKTWTSWHRRTAQTFIVPRKSDATAGARFGNHIASAAAASGMNG